MRRRDVLALLGLAALLPGCAATGAGRSGLRQAGAFRQAAFYDTSNGERLGRRRLFRRIGSAQVLLLGEVHDNMLHHRIRGSLLLDWVRSEPARPAALVFEHFDREHDEALRRVQRRSAGEAPVPRQRGRGDGGAGLDEWLDAARFDRNAWGWPAHRPLFAAARESGATWIAANFSRDAARQLRGEAAKEVDPALRAVVEASRWSAQAQQALDQALLAGHCGQLPQSALPAVARVQRLRDAALALPLLDGAERRSLLLAGNGHVRRDHGVPLYLGALEREALVIGFEEAGAEPAADLAEAVGTARAADYGSAYDFVCLTPAAAGRGDPCAGLPPLSPAGPTQTPSR
jgi:uncharacterized iron-regulated protein